MHFCMLVEPNILKAKKLFKMEVYKPYRQYVKIILSIFMTMRLLWLPFDTLSFVLAKTRTGISKKTRSIGISNTVIT